MFASGAKIGLGAGAGRGAEAKYASTEVTEVSDKFQPIPMESLAAWIFGELEENQAIFGIPRQMFFEPQADDPFTQRVYGQFLETPFGVAAGPHSQMAQNIVVAWLCGARFIELKTVQTLDELEVSKPCIDMPDEGYNVEWSQELKIHQSLDEYVRAWVLIHALHCKFGFSGARPGINFNLSVGYNMEGILKPNMQAFLKSARDVSELKDRYVDLVAKYVPEIRNITIPGVLSDNVTLSTMHGCPPDEIGRISEYLMNEWGLHTSVKLNPTLLGPDMVRDILNNKLGFDEITVPDAAFGHDLKYADALPLLHGLKETAKARGVVFGVKLTNTLEVVNHRKAFSPNEKMMYMSGRPLHAVTAQLAAKIAEEFNGEMLVSFAGGADAFNVADLLACGVSTITTCSDILRAGGYTRMLQYIENTRAAMKQRCARNLAELVRRTGRGQAVENMRDYADKTLVGRLYRKDSFARTRTKTVRKLGLYDCIKAPCVDECPIDQQVPHYMNAVRDGRFAEAIDIVRDDNPLGAILGRACNHLCEEVCIRTHHDEPLAIREIKRFIMDQEKKPHHRKRARARDVKVAVIGGGPCGLSAAYFLLQAGYSVTVFESRAYAGGMVSGTIPGYRASNLMVFQDMKIIEKLGVEIRYNQKAGRDFKLSDLRQQGFKYTVVAAGAQRGAKLEIPGEDAAGVYDALEFLRASRENHPMPLGARVGIIGGGDVAMDCARTAWRLGSPHVEVVYRRTRKEMPAEPEEVAGLLEEGMALRPLTAPKRVVTRDGKMVALACARMELGEPDESGRRRPVEQPNSEFEIPLDNLIVAVSQRPDLAFFDAEKPALTKSGFIEVEKTSLETSLSYVFAGGDVGPAGPSSIVRAVGDGRRIANAIRTREEADLGPRKPGDGEDPNIDLVDLLRRRGEREFRVRIPHRSPDERRDFDEVVLTLPEKDAMREASRCLDCNLLCSYCVGVCPNMAISTYRSAPLNVEMPVLEVRGSKVESVGSEPFHVRQAFQVAVLTDFCNECGNCVTSCPTSGRPYVDKPRLYLNRDEFMAQPKNAFMMFRNGRAWSIHARYDGQTHELVMNGLLTYKSPKATLVVDPASFKVKETKAIATGAEGAISLRPCAEMYVLLRSFKESMPFFPTAQKEG